MAYAESTIIIKKDVNEVFQFILDGKNNKVWRPRVKKVECESNEDIDVGTVFLQEMEGPISMKINADYKIIECNKIKKISFLVLNGPCLPIGTFIFEEVEEGTKVTFSMNEAEIISHERNLHLQKVVDDIQNLKEYFEAEK